jgi:hypothetical protein
MAGQEQLQCESTERKSVTNRWLSAFADLTVVTWFTLLDISSAIVSEVVGVRRSKRRRASVSLAASRPEIRLDGA